MKNLKVILIFLVVAAGVGGFFGGMKYQQTKRPAGFANRITQFGNGKNLRQGTGQNLRPVAGEVLTSEDKSLTVKLQDGSSKIILLSETTALLKSSSGSKDDLKVGERVMVLGTENSDGSVTAQNIQINPPTRGIQ